ncbi:uncharacterized protein LOC109613820 [Musca domestica]|uniref:Uncharacterized protein LOC109613820 n=1 Tax=Musca domestica TaxID=7370 RepID=A0A9J7IIS1_MUSDO|nr:uncharacterized protein LOC109613820 [Musca domestica]
MKIFVVFLLLIQYIWAASVLMPLTTVVRTPQHDTAIVESSRVNGNFAYRTVEGHAYETLTPLIGHVIAPDPLTPVVSYVYVEN